MCAMGPPKLVSPRRVATPRTSSALPRGNSVAEAVSVDELTAGESVVAESATGSSAVSSASDRLRRRGRMYDGLDCPGGELRAVRADAAHRRDPPIRRGSDPAHHLEERLANP